MVNEFFSTTTIGSLLSTMSTSPILSLASTASYLRRLSPLQPSYLHHPIYGFFANLNLGHSLRGHALANIFIECSTNNYIRFYLYDCSIGASKCGCNLCRRILLSWVLITLSLFLRRGGCIKGGLYCAQM